MFTCEIPRNVLKIFLADCIRAQCLNDVPLAAQDKSFWGELERRHRITLGVTCGQPSSMSAAATSRSLKYFKSSKFVFRMTSERMNTKKRVRDLVIERFLNTSPMSGISPSK